MNEFDETQVVAHINEALAKNERRQYSEDELLNVVDMIWDYYEENGLLDIDADDEEDEVSHDEIIDYVTRMCRKDKHCGIDHADIPVIVDAELEYEASLNDE